MDDITSTVPHFYPHRLQIIRQNTKLMSPLASLGAGGFAEIWGRRASAPAVSRKSGAGGHRRRRFRANLGPAGIGAGGFAEIWGRRTSAPAVSRKSGAGGHRRRRFRGNL